jgi:hypothetical protein
MNVESNFPVHGVLEHLGLLFVLLKHNDNFMKAFLPAGISIALAIVVASAGGVTRAQDQPLSSPPTASALPANIAPGTPLAEVVKMIQAGVEVSTVTSYIINSQSTFNLDADKIIFLTDMGAPSVIVNTMMDRDKALYASTAAPPTPPAPPPLPPAPASADPGIPDNTVATGIPDSAPPPDQVNVDYFYDTLSPYGSWVNIDGYGQCWQPTTVIYNASWRPYSDRGHWVYTDYGWYWDSDYSWGVTFHYGRWFHHARFGWCWYPDTMWAPSWVTWRSDVDYFGWAPLPPFAVFTPGVGFLYEGGPVSMDFDFGLGADSFVFISPAHFLDRHPSLFSAKPQYVTTIFSRTKVVNNFSVNSKNVVNAGIGVDRVMGLTHQSLVPVQVSSLPNAGRQGWRGPGFQPASHHVSALYNNNLPFNRSPQSHGAEELEQRPLVAPNAPRVDQRQNFAGSGSLNPGRPQSSPGASQPQPQSPPHYQQNGGNSGNGSSGDPNKQNH